MIMVTPKIIEKGYSTNEALQLLKKNGVELSDDTNENQLLLALYFHSKSDNLMYLIDDEELIGNWIFRQL
ncbi:hypothetical protein MK079_02690 [Candidatus Gracilibacteria bacterium]|nr:hypothetical protein [Candidatus Gracilibacteria bacterium]